MRDPSASETKAPRKWFRDREIILRSDGRITFIKLKRGHQVLASFAIALVLGWGIAGSVGTWMQFQQVKEKSHEIFEAKLTVDQLRADLNAYHQQSTAIMSALSSQSGREEIDKELSELASLDDNLSSLFRKLDININANSEESARIIASRQALTDEIAQLQTELFDAKVEIVDLNSAVKQKMARISAFQSDQVAAEERADGLNRQIAHLSDLLKGSRGEAAALTDELSAVRVTLDVVKEANSVATIRAAALSDQIARLQDALSVSNERGTALSETLARLRQTLSTERRAFAELDREKEGYSTQAARLQGLLEEARLHRRGVESRLAAITAALEDLNRPALSEEQQALAAAEADDLQPQNELALAVRTEGANEEGATPFKQADILAELEALTGDLSADLLESRARKVEVETLIGRVLSTLTEVAGKPTLEGDISPQDASDVVTQTSALIDAIGALHRDQETIVASLSERAELHIDRAEAAMEMAGLGPVELQALGAVINPEQSGQGGPYLSLDFTGGTAQELEASVERLNDMSRRLTLLESVIACAPWITPVDTYQLTSKFGKRRDPINGKMAMHKGVDLAGWPKTPVYATAPGEVTYAGNHGRYGRFVEIDHGCGIVTRYAHLRSVTVKKGQVVTHREKVGTLGSTGRSTGPHVHYEILINGAQVDPMNFVEAGRYFYKN